jgi:hypothetical protein
VPIVFDAGRVEFARFQEVDVAESLRLNVE